MQGLSFGYRVEQAHPAGRALDELDPRHGGAVTRAGAELCAGTRRALGVAGPMSELGGHVGDDGHHLALLVEPAFLALVMSCSARGRNALALASVVTMPSETKRGRPCWPT